MVSADGAAATSEVSSASYCMRRHGTKTGPLPFGDQCESGSVGPGLYLDWRPLMGKPGNKADSVCEGVEGGGADVAASCCLPQSGLSFCSSSAVSVE